MKILILASTTPHSTLTHRMVALGRELVVRGHEVTMIAPSRDKHSGWKLDRPETIDGIRMVYPWQLPSKSTLVTLLPYLLGAAFTVLKHRASVIYISKPTPVTVVGLIAKWRYGTPVILDMDDLGAEVMKGEGQPAYMWRLVMASERLAARNASGLVGVSRLLERLFLAHYRGKPVLRLPNGVDPKEFAMKPLSPARRPRIVFFGILNQTGVMGPVLKALPRVIEAVGLDKVTVDIMGDGKSRKELEAMRNKLGLARNVTFHGWTTYAQFMQLVEAEDIALCVMPESRTTAACSNQKVFQYMAMGLSVIVSDVGDLPQYVASGEAGMVVPAGDDKALSDAIIALLEQPQERRRMAGRGRELARTTYSWSTLAGQLEKFMREVTQ